MSRQWRRVLTLHFEGGRFRDHVIDLEALGELQKFQSIVIETARALWRARNPESMGPPGNFEKHLHLRFREIAAGGTVIPVEAFCEPLAQDAVFDAGDQNLGEASEAVDLIYRVFRAMNENQGVPKECPGRLPGLYAVWGESLADDEALALELPSCTDRVRVTNRERGQLSGFAETSYEYVDTAGRVLKVNRRKNKFQLRLDNKEKVSVAYEEFDEYEVVRAFKKRRKKDLRVCGRGEFGPDGKLKTIHPPHFLRVVPKGWKFDPTAPRLSEMIDEICKDVPDEEWDEFPRDFAERGDFYLYGEDKQ